jgi:hypothetical protein
MDRHVTIVSVLRIGLSVVMMLLAIFLFVLLFGIGIVTQERTAMAILTLVGSLLGIFFLVLGLPGLVGGIGLLGYRSWARILVLIVSAIDLVNVPVGTALGAYSIWVLTHAETVALFEGTHASAEL